MMQQPQAAVATEQKTENGGGDAPPKQVALAMERLGQAARLIADVRLGADRLLEALLAAEEHRLSEKSLKLIDKAEVLMQQHLQDLRVLGRQLEESGVLNESLRSRGDSWGLHMPLVCPDGAVVAYAWKRQLAGQAGASAVDRTRLALKAFTDQKKRFFPHLEDETAGQTCGGDFGILKRQRASQGVIARQVDDLDEHKNLSDLLLSFEKEAPYMKVLTYQRLDWFRRASSLADGNPVDSSKEQSSRNKSKLGSLGSISMDQVAIIELFVPLVFRAVVSLHPAGSTNPDSVAFFSPDESGNYIHPRGSSVYHVYKHVKEHADKALQYFLGVKNDGALSLLLHWICNYQTLFTKACSKCGRLMIVDKPVGLLLPPIYHPYRQSSTMKHPTSQTSPSLKEQICEQSPAYHIGCYSDETQ